MENKKRRRWGKRLAGLLLSVLFLGLSIGETAQASSLPYDTYNYDYWENIVFTPSAYVPDTSVSGVNLGVGAFSSPQDMCVAPDGKIYVADTGNNRIVVLDSTMKNVEKIIEGFERDGQQDTFNAPYGVCVSDKNELYIADSENKRIVVLDENGGFVKIVDNPTSEILEEGYVFTPLKVSVDYADRIYCIGRNMFEGIMVFDANGDFTGFFGTIKVQITLWEKFWRKLATKEERSKQQLFIPTEFTGIDVDPGGFVYASNVDPEGVQAVRRLNPKGEDVIKKGESGNLGGDILISMSGIYSGPSIIVDVVYRENGIYSILDSKRGRIFTYDREGNLLYIFGGLGSQAGTFTIPVAIESSGERVMVLDAYRGEIITFIETRYGNLINEAVSLRYDGDETQAVGKWQEVLKLDENNELANTGIGKAYLTAGDNKTAMKYLKLGMNREYYSIAFKRYRNEILKDNMNFIMTGILVLCVGIYVFKRIWRKKKGKEAEGGIL